MARFTCQFAELDDETQEYLREVRRRAGARCPGVYVPKGNTWPVAAVLTGPVVIAGGIWLALSSSKDAWAVALLLTAAAMLGGWLIVYAFRRWFGGNAPGFAGFFTYFDPNDVYQAAGEQVTVTNVSDASGVRVVHNQSNGSYSSSVVRFDIGQRTVGIPVTGLPHAELAGLYYRTINWLETHDDPKWRELRGADLGGVALYSAVEDALPRDMKEVDLEVTAVPAEPRKATNARGGAVRYLAILGIGAGLYLALWAVMGPTADKLAFESAKGTAGGLRSYLLDDRNTAYRDEAKSLLAKMYDPAVAKVRATDPAVKDAFVALLDSLRTEVGPPVVAFAVREADKPDAAREAQVRTELADAIAQHLGRDLIAFAAPADGKPAHLELVVRYQRALGAVNGIQPVWTLVVRPTPDGPERKTPEQASGDVIDLNTPFMTPGVVKRSVFQTLFGVEPPFIQPIQAGGGWDD